MRAAVGPGRGWLGPLLAVVVAGGERLRFRPEGHARGAVSSVVRIKTFIAPEGHGEESRREREGSGIVIDENGLILTIGYLIGRGACRRGDHQ